MAGNSSLNEIKNTIDRLDASQLKVEKNAFDAINSSDTTLNLVRDGLENVNSLSEKIDAMDVEGQVRDLAAQSAKSSKEISETVRAIQKFTDSLEESLKSITKVVSEQGELRGQVKDIFDQILEAADAENAVAHNMEKEIAYQREITDNVKMAVTYMQENG